LSYALAAALTKLGRQAGEGRVSGAEARASLPGGRIAGLGRCSAAGRLFRFLRPARCLGMESVRAVIVFPARIEAKPQ